MKIFFLFSFLIIASFIFFLQTALGKTNDKKEGPPKAYKGYMIIGNGNVCAAYSDDVRTSASGIQKLYYKNFTASYVRSSYLKISELKNKIVLEEFFSATTNSKGKNENFTLKTFITKDGVIVTRIFADTKEREISFSIVINDTIKTDKLIILSFVPKYDFSINAFSIEWHDGRKMLFASSEKSDNQMILKDEFLIQSKTNKNKYCDFYLLIGENKLELLRKLRAIRKDRDPLHTASKYWNSWIKSGLIPEFADDNVSDFYKRNLYAAYASNLNGMIPADITGQFVTNGMPQLYPRDALMTARAFINSNHISSAIKVLDFWEEKNIPRKTNGELYARYDAYGKAVDAGTGARFDVPEWDSNSYFTILTYLIWKKTGRIKKEHLESFKILLDFLETKVDATGLVYEGGIIEWPGYLPATNMISISAFRKGAEICRSFKDFDRAKKYEIAARIIEANLFKMFDEEMKSFIDLRPKENENSKYLWDTSVNFGLVWNYDINESMVRTNEFIWNNCRKLGNGIQYFDSPNEGLAAYGHDLFFFTTSAAAQYYCKMKDKEKYFLLIKWMMQNSNVYRLMPERIYLSGEDCSPASPLSWCCAEFVNSLIEGYKAGFFER
jgi:GH15 family glucan-1,4-alpha-glucosidase